MTQDDKEKLERYQTALLKIASFYDIGANRLLMDTGSYARFDEPSAVKLARDALGDDYKHLVMTSREVTGEHA